MKQVKLNSFAVHPQFKSTYHCAECKKLMNHESTPPPAPSTGSSMATGGSAGLSSSKGAAISKSFKGAFGL